MEPKTLILIDGHALSFRMFFALERTNMQTTDHTPTWAVFGFFKAIFDMLNNKGLIKPDNIAVAFDVSRHTFRLEKYEDYKANRESMPDSLRPQLSLIMEGLKALNIPIYTKEGFEGDDIIGTISKKAKELGHKTYILTGDRDSLQLVDKEGLIKVLIPSKGELIEYDWDKVYEKLEVYPNQVIDYKALCGDTSDNIPGVRGIGPKTAVSLLKEYKTLDNIYSHLDEIGKKSVVEKLKNEKETAYLSQFLATIKQDVDIDFNFNSTCLEIEDKNNVIEYFKSLQFYSFVKNIDKLLAPFMCKNEAVEIKGEDNIVQFKNDDIEIEPFQTSLFGDIEIQNKKAETKKRNEVEFKNFNLENKISFLIDGDFCYFANDIECSKLGVNEALEILNNPEIKKIAFDIKTTLHKFNKIDGVIDDIMLSSYVLDSSRKSDLISQIQNFLDIIEPNDPYILAGCIYDLSNIYSEKLTDREKKLAALELKLAYVLYKMEAVGVSIDSDYMKKLNDEIDEKIKEYETKIYSEAGVNFNINSPKQVADVLFNVLNIKPKKKNKTGYSTNAKILEELAETNEIARDILEHRTYMKLKTTYVDNLPKLVKEDNRIHTHYNQTVTTTGRLSSSDPNLQNIPIRTEFSNRIRAAFVAKNSDYEILSADYSQIELRLLAHISGDETLKNAFINHDDIHSVTASKIFGVDINSVTKEMRRKAKTVNFGIIYGQTRYGLASSLNITPFEAQEFIDKYFRQYPKISSYITNTLMEAHQTGYVETLFGRRRYLKEELNSRNAKIREFAERAAINAPLQGTSADLIKMAMVDLDEKLKNYRANIIIQVHDELVLEVHKSEIEEVKEIVLASMQLNQPLDVPLDVDIKTGKSWMESKWKNFIFYY